jgi:hypothetical protein
MKTKYNLILFKKQRIVKLNQMDKGKGGEKKNTKFHKKLGYKIFCLIFITFYI